MVFIHFIKITVLRINSWCTVLHMINMATRALLSNDFFPMPILIDFPTFQFQKWSNKVFVFKIMIVSKIKWSNYSVG